MLARVVTFAIVGVEGRRVWVEADIRQGLPAFTIVGLADKAVREARERVRAAMVNSGYEFPAKREQVRSMASAWLAEVRDRPWAAELRFDAIGITLDARGELVRLEHLEGAF